jgi:hypothetical protein
MKSPGTQFLESLLTMASVVMTGAVLVAVGIIVVSINSDHLVHGHDLMIAIVVAIGSLFVVSTAQRLLGYTRGRSW